MGWKHQKDSSWNKVTALTAKARARFACKTNDVRKKIAFCWREVWILFVGRDFILETKKRTSLVPGLVPLLSNCAPRRLTFVFHKERNVIASARITCLCLKKSHVQHSSTGGAITDTKWKKESEVTNESRDLVDPFPPVQEYVPHGDFPLPFAGNETHSKFFFKLYRLYRSTPVNKCSWMLMNVFGPYLPLFTT